MRKKLTIRFIIVGLVSLILTVILLLLVFGNALSSQLDGDAPDNGMDAKWRLFTEALPIVLPVLFLIAAASLLISFFFSRQVVAWMAGILQSIDEDPFSPTPEELEPVASIVREQHIRRLENERVRREFTANVSHELKTPLTSISGYAEMIDNGMARDEDVREFAQKIHQESARLITLIGDIIKLSELDERVNAARAGFELADLHEIARDTLASLSFSAQRKDVSMRLDGMRCVIKGNKAQLSELIYNLCDNAIRYNKRGGFVTVVTRKDADKAVLRVIDTGIGIPMEHRQRIFERFYRVDKSHFREAGGTGLGLAIVKHIALLHGARISIIDNRVGGTEMRVEFPLSS